VTTFCAWPAPGCAAGELLGLRAARVDLAAKRLEVVSVCYDAGRFGRGYKDRPKSRASIRAVPLAAQVTEVIARQLAAASGPRALVFTGPGGGNGVAAGTRTALSRYNLRRAYRDAVARIDNPAAGLPPTAKRVIKALRQLGPELSLEQIGDWLAANGRQLRPATVAAALDRLDRAGLAAKIDAGDGRSPRWSASEPPRGTELDGLELHGPHDLRHTFATWLEDAGIPARVIDELMGHASGRHGRDSSATGPRYRWTTPEMEARAVAAIEQRLAAALAVAARLLPEDWQPSDQGGEEAE